ncbi:MAG TPA: ParB-like protein [Noviherbaspirillum sp.]|uniref:ParB-like protein n=1 Tax=Noviherbaspirillum sp. TaxID=1926288 RepID=UPI002B49C938|nr:ParB-like protein [Noviherbaspirillum sp.]HJV84882.1 ParB-like protein [Noviherbaspirillum sp.]
MQYLHALATRPFHSLLLTLAIVFVATTARAEPACDRSTPIDAKCEISLSALHPTQPAIGLIPVEERVGHFKPVTDFVKYTSKRPVPVVQGPDGTFYLTDSHHLVSVLLRVGADKVMAQVIGRLDDPANFWQEMQARHWVYLFDSKGNSIPPSALPVRIDELADDPYRALATYAETAGYFRRTDAYFMEFEWARYFGMQMGWQPIKRLNLLSALQAAERLACKPEAKDLPGYAGPCQSGNNGMHPVPAN